jgi:hypothetical protein
MAHAQRERSNVVDIDPEKTIKCRILHECSLGFPVHAQCKRSRKVRVVRFFDFAAPERLRRPLQVSLFFLL